MDPMVDVALKAGAPVLTFALGRAWPRAAAEAKYRRTKRFWRPIARSNPMVVVGTHQLPSWESSSLMSVAESKAIDELRAHFRSLYLPAFAVSFGDELPRGRTFDDTLLCLGGPDTSAISARLWRTASTSFAFGDPDRHEIAIHDVSTGDRYSPVGFGGEVTRDYGLIVKMPNPFSQPDAECWALLFAGCLGYGTWGAVRFAVGKAFATDPVVGGSDAIECLVSVDVEVGAPQKIQLLEVRQLGPAGNSAQGTTARLDHGS